MPQVRLPCTLLWPRIGHGPAPGRPRLPRSSSTLTISRTVSTPCSCWVRPRHQAMITRSRPRTIARARGCRPRRCRSWSSSSDQGRGGEELFGIRRSRRCETSRNSRSSTVGSVSAVSSDGFSDAAQKCDVAADPQLHVEGADRAGRAEGRPSSRKSCGTIVRRDAASISGFTWMSCSSAPVGIRQPGEHPRRVRWRRCRPSARSRRPASQSPRSTVPFPVPIAAVSARPLASWHMFEQSGRLFVPNSRTQSW